MTSPSTTKLPVPMFMAMLYLLITPADVPGQPAPPDNEVRSEQKIPEPKDLEAAGATIGRIILEKQDVFDTTQPEENNAFYRLANRWHIITRDSTIRQQLLFKPGDLYSKRVLDESERLLRRNSYLFDASITPVNYADGVIDLRVRTRDVWTLMPGISLSRSGGENRFRVSLSERNLIGTGITTKLTYTEDVDRSSTSFEFRDHNVGNSWASLLFNIADSSDGNTAQVAFERPFYALDTRWSAGANYFDDSREVSFYELGNEMAEYSQDSDFHSIRGGLSSGLKDGWVTRWTAGLVYDRDEFSAVPDATLPVLLPEDRLFVYPFIGISVLQDDFEKTINRDQIGRTEDFYLGTQFSGSLGYASQQFGSDRDAVLYAADLRMGFGLIKSKALILTSAITGRVDEGASTNTRFGIDLRYYNQISDKRLMFVTVSGSIGNNLDLDSYFELGGDTGLRGYPLRYQTGDSRALITIEQRYFTDWYPFRLFRVGGAVFADAGRTWGVSPTGARSLGWLKDVGFGIRLGPTRSSGRDVVHIDIAFPLDGDPSIDNVQFLIEKKRSF